jgi:chemotaxis protein MotB
MNATAAKIYSPNAPSPARQRLWMVTFVDLATLLLAFFVLMFSMSNVDPARYQALAAAYGKAFGSLARDGDEPKIDLPEIAAVSGENLSYLAAVLSATFAQAPSLRGVEFHLTSQYLKLSLPDQEFFEPGSGIFKAEAMATVFDLGGVLSNLDNRIAVIGTAAMGQAGVNDVDMWALAMNRAATVAHALEAAGYNQEVTSFGQGGFPTDVSAALGRVDIYIMPDRPSS